MYAYYEQLYRKRPDLFLWAGLAKMAGGPVYGGMVDAEYARLPLPSWFPGSVLTGTVADFFQGTLMQGNYDIFDDLAWQFRAYDTSGIWALRYVKLKGLDTPFIRRIDIPPWENLWAAEYTSSGSLIRSANYQLTEREQRYIVQPAWTIFATSGITGLEYLLGILAKSPLPGGADFSTVVGLTAKITSFPDRWAWIDSPGNGIWHDWTTLSSGARTGLVTVSLRTRAQSYSLVYGLSFGLFPIIW